KYAYTDQCRRAFVLRYFGDPAARPKCEGCDNCLGIKHEAREGPAASRKRAPKAKSAHAGATSEPLTREEIARADALRQLRTRLAREEEVPAYVIFPDRTLREIARANPRTLADLAKVSGVGPARLEKFGREVLATLA